MVIQATKKLQDLDSHQKAEMDNIGRQIDKIACALYGLTDEEITVVEGAK